MLKVLFLKFYLPRPWICAQFQLRTRIYPFFPASLSYIHILYIVPEYTGQSSNINTVSEQSWYTAQLSFFILEKKGSLAYLWMKMQPAAHSAIFLPLCLRKSSTSSSWKHLYGTLKRMCFLSGTAVTWISQITDAINLCQDFMCLVYSVLWCTLKFLGSVKISLFQNMKLSLICLRIKAKINFTYIDNVHLTRISLSLERDS